MSAESVGDRALFASVENTLQARIGLDVTTVGHSLVARAVQRRMSACAMSDLARYVARLDRDEQELQELVEAVVVPETYFFREPEALDELARRVVRDAWPSPGATLRVLSAPCSTGEEPYSIAMTLLAAGVPASSIAIDAVDVSRDAVRRAVRAEYRASSFRGESLDWRPYFDVVGTERHLRATVRDLVRIQAGNLLDPGFRPPRPEYDVVFCRNLLIYFDLEAQARVLATLRGLLAPHGVLVVGAADSFAVRRAGFAPLAGAERAFLFRLRSEAEHDDGGHPASRDPRAADPVRPRRLPTSRAGAAPTRSAPGTRVVERVAPREMPVAPVPQPTRSADVLDDMLRHGNDGRHVEAIALGEAAIESGHPSADLLTLLGISYEALSDGTRAERSYRRALYVDPTHAEALLHLALLLDKRGDGEGALRLRARARRSFSGGTRGDA
jgi:chemotaxis protein methyltransferase WspC